MLAIAGRGDVHIYPGCAAPLVKVAEDASDIHGATGLGHAELPDVAAPAAAPVHAVDAIRAAARAHEGELVLVATGPLTNVAAALTRAPELAHQVKRLVLMGGAFKAPEMSRRPRNSTSGTIPKRRGSCSGPSAGPARRRWSPSGST